MPNSTDNQDYTENDVNKKGKQPGSAEKSTGPAMGNLALSNKNDEQNADSDSATEDEGNFTSDEQKGKKVDADPEKESDRPIRE